MYLSGLQLLNFRNFQAACFKFSEGANTLIGENDSGKSNAIAGLRILLDDSFFYNAKRLKESDFPYGLSNWRGHWIIISATFSKITDTDKECEICASMLVDDEEIVSSMSSLISTDVREHGVVTLFIRPQKSTRKKLFNANGDAEKFNDIRNKIRLSDYEFYYAAKSKSDFCHEDVYTKLVGDIESCAATDPDEDDSSIMGHRINITDVQDHISLVYVDALRDVLRELHTPKNPIRRIIETIEGNIDLVNISEVKNKIKELNEAITGIDEIDIIGHGLNSKLLDILGVVYSPEIKLSSELSDEINSLSRFISMKPRHEDNLELLGLGHLNMIYLALKIVEFEACRSRELLNIMVVEEPEAHIHSHIQKTLFGNLSVVKNYTQVLMTTHSVHLAESSEISRMNIIKSHKQLSFAMQPIHKLDQYGKESLNKASLSLSKCIERYLDAKRNVLLFSKGVVLVEGDAEEILLPNMVKSSYGISLDEIGVGLVNVGSTAFEYIASVFDSSRIQRYCAIVTDLDKQAVADDSVHYKEAAEDKGKERQKKLNRLYTSNAWVNTFYAEHTFEIEFINCGDNNTYLSNVIKNIFTQGAAIARHQGKINDASTRNEEMLTLAKKEGKGWLATLMAGELDATVSFPDYLVDAIAFAAQETISIQIYLKMLKHSLSFYRSENAEEYLANLTKKNDEASLIDSIKTIISDSDFKDDEVVKFVIACEGNQDLLSSGGTP